MRKTPNRSAGEPLSNVQHRRAGREEPEPGRPARPRCQTPPHGPGRVPRRRPRSRQMKQHPRNRSEKTPARPAAALRQTPPGVRPRPNPAGDRTHRTGPGLWAAAPDEKGSAPSDVSGNVRADHCDRPYSSAFLPPRITLFLPFPNNLTGAWFSLTYGCLHRRAGALLSQCTYRCVVLPDGHVGHDGLQQGGSQCTYRCVVLPDALRDKRDDLLAENVSMHLQVRGAP